MRQNEFAAFQSFHGAAVGVKVPEFNEKFADVKSFSLGQLTVAAEAPEVDVVADGRGFGGILSAGKIQNSRVHIPEPKGQLLL